MTGNARTCVLAMLLGLAACGGGDSGAAAPPPAGTATVTVVNHHCTIVVRGGMDGDFYDVQIRPGETLTVTDVAVGTHTLEAWSEEGLHWSYPVTIGAAGLTWTINMPAGTGCLKLVNNTGMTMTGFYLVGAPSGCTSSSWGSNRLPVSVPSGRSVVFSEVHQGTYDVRADAGTGIWRACSWSVGAGTTSTLTMNPL